MNTLLQLTAAILMASPSATDQDIENNYTYIDKGNYYEMKTCEKLAQGLNSAAKTQRLGVHYWCSEIFNISMWYEGV